jgi:hypothetical protein
VSTDTAQIMGVRRRYWYCRFWGQTRLHSLWFALFVPNHYKDVERD